MIKAVFEKTKIICGQTGSDKTYIMMGNNHIENDKGPTVPWFIFIICSRYF